MGRTNPTESEKNLTFHTKSALKHELQPPETIHLEERQYRDDRNRQGRVWKNSNDVDDAVVIEIPRD